jgi:diguanylate cyclase (GGDEF)-like protein/PAS domain S-box-containing protein
MAYSPRPFRLTMLLAGALGVLSLLGLLAWWEQQQAEQRHQALARNAAQMLAQYTGDYFNQAAALATNLVRRETALLDRLLKDRQDTDAKQRLSSLLYAQLPDLRAYSLLDRAGNVAFRITSLDKSGAFSTPVAQTPAPTQKPLRLRVVGDAVSADINAPWRQQGELQGRLLLTIGCANLCDALQTANADKAFLALAPNSTDAPVSANIPGTDWQVVQRVPQDGFNEPWLKTLLWGLMFGAPAAAAALLLIFGVKGRARKTRPGLAYRAAFNSSQVAQLLVDGVSGRLIDANPPAMALFALDNKPLAEQSLQHLLQLDQHLFETYIKTLQDTPQLRFARSFKNTAGQTLKRELQINTVDSAEGVLFIVSLINTAEQTQMKGASQNNEEKLSAILNASSDGIIMTDADGMVQIFNPAAEMMFGYLKEEIVGRHLRVLMPTCFAEDPHADLDSWSAHGPSSLGAVRETAGMCKSGESLPLRVSLNRVSLDQQLHFVALVQDLTEQRRNEKQLNYLERKDVLTGLLNRREFERRLDALLSFSDYIETEYALCYIDVDQFKVVNDTCGHVAGDELLKQLAILIKSQFKTSETIARLGGDEFGVLLTDCSIERAEAFSNGLLQTVRNFLFTWRDQSFDVAVSIGLTGFRPHAENASRVLSEADVACHMAKRRGRDRAHIYHQGDSDLIRHHGDMHLVSAINKALNEGRFHLYAQPIVPVAMADQSHTHYEILVRMVDEHGHLVIPDHFIPAAERYILMPAIDRWVIGRLFEIQGENLRRWAQYHSAKSGFLFGINLSGTSLTDGGFLNYLKRQFTEYAIPYHTICFEITETAAVANLERAKTLIEELRGLGCSFALDDFGTGLSSYSYLKILPVDYLKIDGSFVRNMTKDPVDYAMVDSINQIGHILGLRTIAEWAENLDTLTQLRALNVDFAQGYGVGDMISVEDFHLPIVTPPPSTLPNEPHRFTH